MKTNKSFGELVLNVWAAIVRVLMARYCVRCLTLKTRENAQRYLLGSKKELELINKLGLADKEIRERIWSHETKVELLRRGCKALLSEVKTEEELNAVVEMRNTHALINTMRVYTPTSEKMRELCASLEILTLKALAQKTPWVFDSLTPLEVLGAKADEIVPATAERWQVAWFLAEARPEWAPKFLLQLRNIVPSKLGEEGYALMTKFFNIAFEAKVDISAMMPYFYVLRPDLYAKVRENWAEYESITPYFKLLFPQLLKYLKKNQDGSFEEIKTAGEKLSDAEEVYAWLKMGFERLGEQTVYTILLQNIFQIKKNVQRPLFEQLFERMVAKAPSSSDLVFLYNVVEKPERTAIPSILVSRVERKEAGASLRQLFPFEGWSEALVTRAVKAMVAKKEFPVERLGELSKEMQRVAVEEMETRSQIEAIDKGDVAQLVETTKLYPAVECHLFSQSCMQKYQHAYLERWQLDESTFSWIVKTIKLSRERQEDFIFLYAKKWGLTEEQYLQVMQSWLADKAPFLKSFVKSEEA